MEKLCKKEVLNKYRNHTFFSQNKDDVISIITRIAFFVFLTVVSFMPWILPEVYNKGLLWIQLYPWKSMLRS